MFPSDPICIGIGLSCLYCHELLLISTGDFYEGENTLDLYKVFGRLGIRFSRAIVNFNAEP